MTPIKLISITLIILTLVTACVDHESTSSKTNTSTEREKFVGYCENKSLSDDEQHTIQALFEKEQVASCEALYSELSDFAYTTLWGKEIKNFTVFNYVSIITRLNLSKNKIENLSALKNMQRLTLLDLSDNVISDTSPLSNLVKLESLDLRNNNVSDIRPLLTNKNLKKLFLSGNPIKKESLYCPIKTDNDAINKACFDHHKFNLEFTDENNDTRLNSKLINEFLPIIVNNSDLSIYYHADKIPERAPLIIYIDNIPDNFTSDLKKFGQAIKFVSNPIRKSLNLNISVKGKVAMVRLKYSPEGISGFMKFRYYDNSWNLMHTEIRE